MYIIINCYSVYVSCFVCVCEACFGEYWIICKEFAISILNFILRKNIQMKLLLRKLNHDRRHMLNPIIRNLLQRLWYKYWARLCIQSERIYLRKDYGIYSFELFTKTLQKSIWVTYQYFMYILQSPNYSNIKPKIH